MVAPLLPPCQRNVPMDKKSPAPVANSEPKTRFATSSQIELGTVYTPDDVRDLDAERDLGQPGTYPFTRGIHPAMYREKLWTMRQYAGYATAEESNRRYKYLLAHGQMGLSVAFDLPTQLGLDSDHPLAHGEVGKVGVAIDSLQDMETLLEGIPVEKVSTSMTINATAAILLALYVAVARRRGIDPRRLRGTLQNDILKEYIARGTYIYPPKPSMRLVTDVFAFCREHMPSWNTISISGYHIREAGATAVQEVAFTLANAVAYVRAAQAAGLEVDEFAPRLSFFFNAHNDLFEEVAKFRAARRLWARIMKEEFGARDPRSQMLRFHAQTAGSALTAQQPEVNVVRVTVQALAAVLGGAQSLHTNARDEALALPTEESARLALRTQQVLAYESGVAGTVDPLGGSYYVESLTREIEDRARQYLDRIESLGGALAAIEQGFVQHEIQEAAYAQQRRVESKEEIVVGVNRFTSDDASRSFPVLTIDPGLEAEQVRKLRQVKATRHSDVVARALQGVERAARSGQNLIPPILTAVESLATLGEIAGTLKNVFGEYRESVVL
ncbi:MAG: methylmalonyl-CoA mutase family protein [Acidobacteria bacterium]|nr:methylmalonyl-CoA mutase family protein [Acidobacteriota bacterium]